MNTIKKIQYNCRHATFLIEKKQIQRIGLLQELQLRIHLAGCLVCRTFQTQSIMINQMVKGLFKTSGQLVKMDEHFKKEMQQKIEEKLKKQ